MLRPFKVHLFHFLSQAEVYGIDKNVSREEIIKIVATVNVPVFEPKVCSLVRSMEV